MARLVARTTQGQDGAAVVEITFAILFIMFLSLGVVQVALTLYARNVVAASAHEGARTALERGRDHGEAVLIARQVVQSATGRLVDDLEVDLSSRRTGNEVAVTVVVTGVVDRIGPVPVPVPLRAIATARSNIADR